MSGRRIAFHAPLKAPDHPVASGDRTMGRGLLAALRSGGFEPEVVSTLRAFDGEGDPARFQLLARAARGEAALYIERCRALPPPKRPQAMFTYHCYFRAPDLVGPVVAGALGIPYLIAEPSSAPKRAHGRWAASHAAAELAFDAADCLLVMTARDRVMMERRARPGQSLRYFPPFCARTPELGSRAPKGDGPVELLTVAMMRDSNKLCSYRALAGALGRIRDAPWRLSIVGDGPARGRVEAAFAPLGDRVAFLGLIADAAALDRLYRSADIFVWPAVTEAYGMALLEAQACGTPAVAGRDGGVPDVVEHERTGILTPPNDPDAFATAVLRLMRDRELRERLGRNAAEFVRTERSLSAATRRLVVAIDAALVAHPDCRAGR